MVAVLYVVVTPCMLRLRIASSHCRCWGLVEAEPQEKAVAAGQWSLLFVMGSTVQPDVGTAASAAARRDVISYSSNEILTKL